MDESTNEDTQPPTGSTWLGWITVVLGLWVIVSPFIWGDNSATSVNWLLWSNIVSGMLIAILAGFVATR